MGGLCAIIAIETEAVAYLIGGLFALVTLCLLLTLRR